jgi:hypothetical protein
MRVTLAVCIVTAAITPTALRAASPFDGTWKQDDASASFSKKPMKIVVNNAIFECSTCTPAIRVKADGTDQPVTGHPAFDAVAIKIVDDKTLTETNKHKGKIVQNETITVSKDGRAATVNWTDSTSAAPITGTTNLVLVAHGPAGSHAVSGAWTVASVANTSDTGSLMTFAVADGALNFSTPAGLSYSAKLGGPPAPFKGDPRITTVAVKQLGARAIEETDFRDGKPVEVVTLKLTPDGKTMSILYNNKVSGRTASFKALKQ